MKSKKDKQSYLYVWLSLNIYCNLILRPCSKIRPNKIEVKISIKKIFQLFLVHLVKKIKIRKKNTTCQLISVIII